MRGRPLGFLALVVAGWVGVRAVMLWPEPVLRVAAGKDHDPPQPPLLPMGVRPAILIGSVPASPGIRKTVAGHRQLNARVPALHGPDDLIDVEPQAGGVAPLGMPAPSVDAVGAAVASANPAPSRWSVAGWLVLREGRADPRLTPLLGASQAGVRVSYALLSDRRTAVFARAAAPLSHGGVELAAGLQWRPERLPVTAFAEARRRPGAGLAPAVGVFGGGTVDLSGDVRLDSYGQAGWVGGRYATGFAEGQARAARTVAQLGGVAVDVGAGAWGAAQRGAARLDIGPGAGVTMPLGHGSVRLGFDWRQRIAGRAAPGSGAVLTLGAGF